MAGADPPGLTPIDGAEYRETYADSAWSRTARRAERRPPANRVCLARHPTEE